MTNPFEGQTPDPIQADMQSVKAALEKDLSSQPNAAGRLARLRHLLTSRSVFVDPTAGDALVKDLDAYTGDDPVEFILRRAVEVWKREGKYDDPLKYKARLFRADRERDGYTFINDVFYYATDNGIAHIHLNNPYAYADADTPGAKLVVLRQFVKGLSGLAETLRGKNDVKKVAAVSHLLTNPTMVKFLESLGFNNLGPISDEFRQAHFRGETRDITQMVADAEEFCEKAKDAKDLQTMLMSALKKQRENA